MLRYHRVQRACGKQNLIIKGNICDRTKLRKSRIQSGIVSLHCGGEPKLLSEPQLIWRTRLELVYNASENVTRITLRVYSRRRGAQ